MKALTNLRALSLIAVAMVFTITSSAAQKVQQASVWPGTKVEKLKKKKEAVKKQAKEDGDKEVDSLILATKKKKRIVRVIRRKTIPGKKKRIRRIVRRVKKKPATPAVVAASAVIASPISEVLPPKSASKFKLTPIAGMTYGTIDGDFLSNAFSNNMQYDFGFTGGALAEYNSPDSKLGYEGGVIYMQTGARGETGNNNLFLVNSNTLNYIVNDYIYGSAAIKYYITKSAKMSFFIKAGALIGSLVSSDMEIQNLQGFAFNLDGQDFFKSSDTRWQATVGGKFAIGSSMSAIVEASYNRSTSSISDDSLSNGNLFLGNPFAFGGDAFNSGLSLSAGLSIDL